MVFLSLKKPKEGQALLLILSQRSSSTLPTGVNKLKTGIGLCYPESLRTEPVVQCHRSTRIKVSPKVEISEQPTVWYAGTSSLYALG